MTNEKSRDPSVKLLEAIRTDSMKFRRAIRKLKHTDPGLWNHLEALAVAIDCSAELAIDEIGALLKCNDICRQTANQALIAVLQTPPTPTVNPN